MERWPVVLALSASQDKPHSQDTLWLGWTLEQEVTVVYVSSDPVGGCMNIINTLDIEFKFRAWKLKPAF